jgi:hypothetical protein
MACERFAAILSSLEQDIADYYGFALLHRAQDHLVSDELVPEIGRLRGRTDSFRAAVYFSETGGEFAIGVHFDPKIRNTLLADNPKFSLSNTNLDAFCVLVEELSHFHLLINRASADKQISFLELEWQAEIDKLLFCGIYLERLVGDPHIQPLLKLLFSPGCEDPNLAPHYADAGRFAARFWLDAASRGLHKRKCLEEDSFRKFMQRNYLEALPEKRRLSDGASVLRVA